MSEGPGPSVGAGDGHWTLGKWSRGTGPPRTGWLQSRRHLCSEGRAGPPPPFIARGLKCVVCTTPHLCQGFWICSLKPLISPHPRGLHREPSLCDSVIRAQEYSSLSETAGPCCHVYKRKTKGQEAFERKGMELGDTAQTRPAGHGRTNPESNRLA